MSTKWIAAAARADLMRIGAEIREALEPEEMTADLAEIETALADARELEGDVYTLERDRTGRHGSIMKYNLNKGE